jgi:hypothetical protein
VSRRDDFEPSMGESNDLVCEYQAIIRKSESPSGPATSTLYTVSFKHTSWPGSAKPSTHAG